MASDSLRPFQLPAAMRAWIDAQPDLDMWRAPDPEPPPERPALPPNAISGWELRTVVTLMLHDLGCVVSVPEIVSRLEAMGFALVGRPSKVVSDALRVEVRKGRVARVGRGHYGPGVLPRTTKHRYRRGMQRIRDLRLGPHAA